jgi:SAM-dependent methyltransferase
MNATIDYPINWHDPSSSAHRQCLIPCPVCGAGGSKAAVLTTPSVGDPRRRRLVTFLRCAACSSVFTEDRVPFEYELAQSPWASEFYLEQGAGLDSMIAPILHLPPEPKRSMLEVGCGFGFALHFARQQRGWIVRGIDPSPIASEGRRVLGLDIRSAYLTEASHPDDIYDVILASEVIEHLPQAGPVLRTMCAALSPPGVLALTTPDAAYVSQATDLGTLLPVLSPGHHLTLYSATGLEHDLRAAGFTRVKIEQRGPALVAWASREPLFLRPPTEDDRGAYETWLATLADDPALPPSLRGGMAYRLLRARVNAGAETAARDVFAAVAIFSRERFALDLSVPPLLSADMSREMVGSTPRRIPYNLAGVSYYRGMIEMGGTTPGEGAPWFDAAERIARGCCAFYRSHGIDDGETADLVRRSARLALLALCHRDPAAVVSRLGEWTEVAPEEATELSLRLLDLGHLEAASAVAEHAESAMLSALAEGYIALIRHNDPQAAAIAFRNAEQLAEPPSPTLAERLLFGLVISAASEEPAAAVARLLAAPAAPDWIVRSLFVRLTDLGRLAEATALEPLGGSLADDWQVMNARGMIALNHRRDGAAAAALFADAFARAHTAGVEGDALWRVKYHEAFAWKSIGRIDPARSAARMLLNPQPGLPPAPPAVIAATRELELFAEKRTDAR